MIKFFTAQEKTVIITLSSFLDIGYMIESVKDYYYKGLDHLTYLYISEEVVNYYSKLIHNEIKIVMMHINATGINV